MVAALILIAVLLMLVLTPYMLFRTTKGAYKALETTMDHLSTPKEPYNHKNEDGASKAIERTLYLLSRTCVVAFFWFIVTR